MNRISAFSALLMITVLILTAPSICSAQDGEHIKWYGLGGELTGPHRWLGRIGINEYLGTEVIFGMEHTSYDCHGGAGDCDSTALDVGVGVIYDFVPSARISPYLAGRFILTMTGNGESDTAGTIEAASGVEYIIMKRIGLSGELNFSFHTDPTKVKTSTIVRFYFYF
jgi:hypothetical protein